MACYPRSRDGLTIAECCRRFGGDRVLGQIGQWAGEMFETPEDVEAWFTLRPSKWVAFLRELERIAVSKPLAEAKPAEADKTKNNVIP